MTTKPIHTVEIKVMTAVNATDVKQEPNEVGVVVPAVLKGLRNEDVVRFKNATGADVKVWLPIDCLGDLGDPSGIIELKDGATSADGMVKAADFGAKQEVMYHVYCKGIGEFAVGNSPPKMKIGD